MTQYAFMCLPVSAFQDGEINYDNTGIGRLFEVRTPVHACNGKPSPGSHHA